MEVGFCRAQGHVESYEAPHAERRRRDIGCDHRRVGNDDHIGGKPVALALEQVLEVGAADLLFAFDQELQVDRQGSHFAEQAPYRLGLHEDLALVVGTSHAPGAWPSTTTGSKGGDVHSSSGSTGWTSWWP